MSSAFVFPLEMLIWGTGAVFARYFVRKIQARLVQPRPAGPGAGHGRGTADPADLVRFSWSSRLQHQEYGRALGFNYVYFVWAMLYEAILVVLRACSHRRTDVPRAPGTVAGSTSWGMIPLIVLFVPASFAAWYGWNIVARDKVFHLPPYYIGPRPRRHFGRPHRGGDEVLLAVGPARRLLAWRRQADDPAASPCRVRAEHRGHGGGLCHRTAGLRHQGPTCRRPCPWPPASFSDWP
ncbi:MAG: hypothetical protein WDN06_00500 [Asticcacaulis sp.]